MAHVLVIYAGSHGQSARIAERIAATLAACGHRAGVRPVDDPALAAWLNDADAVILGGSLHQGRHMRSLERLARRHAEVLDARPNAFFSVSLSAAGDAKQVAEARGCVDKFVARTGWRPGAIALFAGALPYSKYNALTRFVMRLIARAAHGDTDTSRDYEYTDWAQVERFARDFAKRFDSALAA